MLATDVAPCAQNAPVESAVSNAQRMMSSALMETVREKETESKMALPRGWLMPDQEQSLDRDLADSLERIDLLEGENQVLLSSLRSLTASPSFQPTEHGDIVDLLSKVSSISPRPDLYSHA